MPSRCHPIASYEVTARRRAGGERFFYQMIGERQPT
jgi:hypothetical protein